MNIRRKELALAAKCTFMPFLRLKSWSTLFLFFILTNDQGGCQARQESSFFISEHSALRWWNEGSFVTNSNLLGCPKSCLSLSENGHGVRDCREIWGFGEKELKQSCHSSGVFRGNKPAYHGDLVLWSISLPWKVKVWEFGESGLLRSRAYPHVSFIHRQEQWPQ